MNTKSALTAMAFLGTIPAANWLIHNVGTVCVPDGPCLIPVAPGLMAPSGVLLIGAGLVLRDAVHEQLGHRWVIGLIALGAALSWVVSDPFLAAASAAAFLLSELADLAVYAPLRRRSVALAILASGAVGSVIDSAVFLWIAFGSLEFVAGQIVGKLLMSVAAVFVLRWVK